MIDPMIVSRLVGRSREAGPAQRRAGTTCGESGHSGALLGRADAIVTHTQQAPDVKP